MWNKSVIWSVIFIAFQSFQIYPPSAEENNYVLPVLLRQWFCSALLWRLLGLLSYVSEPLGGVLCVGLYLCRFCFSLLFVEDKEHLPDTGKHTFIHEG